jgi:type I restriction enzyme R subunit
MLSDPSEAETRRLIDSQLKAAGWNVDDTLQVRREVRLRPDRVLREDAPAYGPDQSGDDFADYVLYRRDGKPIAIVEAKRSRRDPLEGERQAEEYADRVEAHDQVMMFIYLANGRQIWFLDRGRFPVREISQFYTPDDLERLVFQRQYGQALRELGPKPDIINRPYQFEAVQRVAEALENGRRRFLLVMATGTGKTRTAIALVELLMRARRAQRVLFLADRRELVRQALSAFKEHLPYESRDRIEGGEINHGARIHVATYPSMMQVYRQLSMGYYDLIIADESHRSIYDSYQRIFEHFDALIMGLTATPTDFIDHNTFKLFECLDGLPTFEYGYQAAVDDRYLAQYRVLESKTKFQLEGIKAGQLPPEVQRQLSENGIDLSEINFEGTDLERRVTNTGTNEAMAAEFVNQCRKDASGTLPAKTIIFAMTHAHALELYKAFNRLYPEWQRRGLARVIDSQMERADTLLDDFKFRDMPRVAISVDMLDTGIDVPSIQNLVFAKPVFSQVKFWQMIGRGTRLWMDAATGRHKTDFFILDFWDNFAYFNLNPQGETPSSDTPLPVRVFRQRLEKLAILRGLNDGAAVSETVTQLQDMLARIPTDNLNVRPHLPALAEYAQAETWTKIDEARSAELNHTLAPLLRFLPEVNLKVMVFESRTEQLALAQLTGDADTIEHLREKIAEDLRALPAALPEVQAQAETIAWVQSDGFWDHLDYARIMQAQHALAPLMRYRLIKQQQIVRLELHDKIVQQLWIAYGPTGEGAFVQTYRGEVEAYVRDLAARLPALQKVQQGADLNDDELALLERELNQADLFITEDTLRRAYEQPRAHLIDFLRHILKVAELPNREAEITRAFEAFIQAHPQYRASQLQFLRLVRSAVIARAQLTTEAFTLPPFTRIGQAEVLFTPQQLAEIVAFANQYTE